MMLPLNGCCTAMRSHTMSTPTPSWHVSTTWPGASWPSLPGTASETCGSPKKCFYSVSYNLLLARGGCGTISLSIRGKIERANGWKQRDQGIECDNFL